MMLSKLKLLFTPAARTFIELNPTGEDPDDAPRSAKSIKIGDVRLDATLLARQLRNDLRDDWFPDPLLFGDMLSPDVLGQLINRNVEVNRGVYRASNRTLLNIPKTGFTLRYALETSLSDRALYQGLSGFLIPFYDRLLPWNAFSHRYDYERARSSSKYTFKNGIQAWKYFVGAARSAVTVNNYLLSTDVANFFENIQFSRLEAEMKRLETELLATESELVSICAHRKLLFEYLEHWAYEPGRGLPQNRDASSFLANLYMRQVDLRMINAGYTETYFRYMDDIKIVCKDEFEARKALKQLSVTLREIGLSVNSRKTQIVSGLDLAEVERCLDGSSEAIEKIDELWQRRTRKAIFALWPTLRDRTLELISEGAVDSREFRYCIKRIELLASFEDLHFPKEIYEPITHAICQAVASHPACTDQYVKYLTAVQVTPMELMPVIDYLCEPEKSIYTWQSYRLWLLLAAKAIADPRLTAAAMAAVAGPDTPVRAGASIYLGVLGISEGKDAVAREFSTAVSFIGQRSALIAIHELPFGQIENQIRPHMRPDLQGVFRALGKRDRKGTYFAPKDAIRIDLGGDEEMAYE